MLSIGMQIPASSSEKGDDWRKLQHTSHEEEGVILLTALVIKRRFDLGVENV